MNRGDIISLMKVMWGHCQKQETEIRILEKKTKKLEFLNAMLPDHLTPTQRKQFGPFSEKYADGHTQLNLFNGAEQEVDPGAPEPEMKEIHPSSYRRKKRSGKKEEDPSALETTEAIEYKLTDADRGCPDYNTKYKVVTKETVKRLKLVPARFEVAEEVTYVYSYPKCEAMERPKKTLSLLKGSVATPSLVAGIMNAKYAGGMPLAHQEWESIRYGLNLPTKTMANWTIWCTDQYLQSLYELVKEEFPRNRYAHGDGTCVQIIDEPEQKGSIQNWMWAYLTDEYSGLPRMVLFQYERTWAGYHPVKFLRNQSRGYFIYNGYQAYRSLPERIAIARYMAHTRRRFDESVTVLREDFTKERLKETTTYWAMARIGTFRRIEEMIRGKSPGERYEERQKQAEPLLEAPFKWPRILEETVDRSFKVGEVALYTLNQETYLKRRLEDGHLSIDNLAAERALENFAIGRHNWLSAKSIRGAQASVTVYSTTETALLNGPKPCDYLICVMGKMKDLGTFLAREEMLELLPWSSDLSDDCRNKLKK